MRTFLVLSWSTLVVVYLVIVAGGIVRMTGSGMGCPDWPKCFGQYIPPTSADQLPSNYKEIYAQKRAAKIQKFATQLEKIGMSNKAELLRTDDSLLEEQDFNVAHTWTEYINRLVGALSGLLVLGCTFFAVYFFKKDKRLLFLCLVQLAVLLFQAWMGSIVVATNITPWVLTTHMLLALLIIFIQVLIIRRLSDRQALDFSRNMKFFLLAGLLLMLAQIVLGTQVRQEVDEVAKQFSREDWISQLAGMFEMHRTFAIVVVILHLLLLREALKNKIAAKPIIVLFVLVLLVALSGKFLADFSFPALIQPFHLVSATVICGMQFYLLFGRKKRL
ncbi:MAG: COX15/CtaA family protein [Flavobacteriales bacterium]